MFEKVSSSIITLAAAGFILVGPLTFITLFFAGVQAAAWVILAFIFFFVALYIIGVRRST